MKKRAGCCLPAAGCRRRLETGSWMAEFRRILPAIAAAMWKRKTAKGQASIEFMIMSFFALAFFLASTLIYLQESTEALELRQESEMRSICASLSAKVSGLEIAGPGSSARLDYPEGTRAGNYSIWVHVDEGMVQVVLEDIGGEFSTVGCLLKSRGVANAAGEDVFRVAPNATLRNADGVVLFG
ncbi:MAG: hypothetical protein NTY83_02685 [Candidatus Micrarchaeota archaeon]|nr:hypothetical protein [Candidatus Micrarchaeota archaeon]